MKALSHGTIVTAALSLLSVAVAASFATTRPALTGVTQDRTAVLTVQVSDEAGAPVSGAHVNVYQSWMNRRTSIVMPPEYQAETDASGIARLNIAVKAGATLVLSIEVSREDLQSERWDGIDFGKDFPPRLPLQKFTLGPKKGNVENSINLSVNVMDNKDNPVEGAQVSVRSPIWGNRKWSGATGSDGSVVIPVPATLDPSSKTTRTEPWNITASKRGYKDGNTSIRTGVDEIGTAVDAGTITLERTDQADVTVTVTVTDERTRNLVSGATVSLEGESSSDSATTDASGKATLRVAGLGDYRVSISHDNYYAGGGSIRVLKDETAKAGEFALTPKESADAGADTLDVTVSGKDTADETSQTAPVAGARVTDGRTTVTTDGSGRATLRGVFDGEYVVTVTAEGFHSQTKGVAVHGTGSMSFTLDPQLSEKSPLAVIVKVYDAAGKPISGADVDFLSAGRLLYAGRTNANGERDFRSRLDNSSGLPLAELRRGLTINVRAKSYKPVGSRAIPAELLQPSLTASVYTVSLERDWSELASQIAALEARVSSWASDKAQVSGKESLNAFINRARQAEKRAQDLFQEIRVAHNQLVFAPGGVASHCAKADPLQQKIIAGSTQVHQKAGELKKVLDDANGAAAKCATPEDAEGVRSKYREAIKMLGEIGALEKKAAKDRDELSKLAEQSQDLKRIADEMQKKVGEIRDQVDAASEVESEATQHLAHIASLKNSLLSRQLTLKAEWAVLSTKYDSERSAIPVEAVTDEFKGFGQKLDQMKRRLYTGDDMSYNPPVLPQSEGSLPPEITNAVGRTTALNTEAQTLAQIYSAAACNIDTMDATVEAMSTENTGAMIEVSAGADLLKVADDCVARATNGDASTVENASGDVNRSPVVEEIPDALDPAKNKPAHAPTSDNTDWLKRATNDANKATKNSVDTVKNNPSKPKKPPVVEEIPDALDPGKSNSGGSRTASQKPPVVEEIPDALDPGKSKSRGSRTASQKPPVVEEIPDALDPGKPRVQPSGGSNSSSSSGGNNSSSGSAQNTQASNKPKKEKKPRDPNKPSTAETVGKILDSIAGEIIRQRTNRGTGPGSSGGSSGGGGDTGGSSGSGETTSGGNTGGSGGSTGVGGVSPGGTAGGGGISGGPDYGLFGDWGGGSDSDEGCPVSWEIIGIEQRDEAGKWAGVLKATHSCPHLTPSPNAARFPQLFGAYQGYIEFTIIGPGQLRASMRSSSDSPIYVDGTFTDTRNPGAKLTLSDGRRQVTFTRRVK